jgi:dTDP-glucose 4,6-dehydratase
LVTGGSGFIGAHVVKYFLEKTDWSLIVPVTFRHKGEPIRLAESLQLYPERLTIVLADLTSPFTDRMVKMIGGQIDYIVNAASGSHVKRSIEDPVPFVQNNVELVLTVLELARKVRPQKFIHVSTDEVYGPATGTAHTEWDTLRPSNPYSGSKAAQEVIAHSYWRTYGVPLIISNSMNNFGEMQDLEKYVPMVISKVLNEEVVQVHGTPGNIGARAWMHARTHADALLWMLNNAEAPLYPEAQQPTRFTISGAKRLDNLTMAKLIAEYAEMPLKYELVDPHGERPGYDSVYDINDQRLTEAGWKPSHRFEEQLKGTVQWTKANRRFWT